MEVPSQLSEDDAGGGRFVFGHHVEEGPGRCRAEVGVYNQACNWIPAMQQHHVHHSKLIVKRHVLCVHLSGMIIPCIASMLRRCARVPGYLSLSLRFGSTCPDHMNGMNMVSAIVAHLLNICLLHDVKMIVPDLLPVKTCFRSAVLKVLTSAVASRSDGQ